LGWARDETHVSQKNRDKTNVKRKGENKLGKGGKAIKKWDTKR
jgi:hypothetical protein